MLKNYIPKRNFSVSLKAKLGSLGVQSYTQEVPFRLFSWGNATTPIVKVRDAELPLVATNTLIPPPYKGIFEAHSSYAFLDWPSLIPTKGLSFWSSPLWTPGKLWFTIAEKATLPDDLILCHNCKYNAGKTMVHHYSLLPATEMTVEVFWEKLVAFRKTVEEGGQWQKTLDTEKPPRMELSPIPKEASILEKGTLLGLQKVILSFEDNAEITASPEEANQLCHEALCLRIWYENLVQAVDRVLMFTGKPHGKLSPAKPIFLPMSPFIKKVLVEDVTKAVVALAETASSRGDDDEANDLSYVATFLPVMVKAGDSFKVE